VLLGDLTHRLVRDYVDVEAVEPLQLKGKSERAPAYRLVGGRDGAERPRRLDAPMVGREGEGEGEGEASLAPTVGCAVLVGADVRRRGEPRVALVQGRALAPERAQVTADSPRSAFTSAKKSESGSTR
jgi:hypothetical protein